MVNGPKFNQLKTGVRSRADDDDTITVGDIKIEYKSNSELHNHDPEYKVLQDDDMVCHYKDDLGKASGNTEWKLYEEIINDDDVIGFLYDYIDDYVIDHTSGDQGDALFLRRFLDDWKLQLQEINGTFVGKIHFDGKVVAKYSHESLEDVGHHLIDKAIEFHFKPPEEENYDEWDFSGMG